MPPTLTEERPTTEERVSRIEAVLPHLATKADVAELRADVTMRIAESEARTAALIAEVRAEMAKFETRMVRWMIASLSLAIAVVTVVYRVMS